MITEKLKKRNPMRYFGLLGNLPPGQYEVDIEQKIKTSEIKSLDFSLLLL